MFSIENKTYYTQIMYQYNWQRTNFTHPTWELVVFLTLTYVPVTTDALWASHISRLENYLYKRLTQTLLNLVWLIKELINKMVVNYVGPLKASIQIRASITPKAENKSPSTVQYPRATKGHFTLEAKVIFVGNSF